MLNKIISLALAGMIISLCHFPAQAAPFTTTRYVRIDLKGHTGLMYDQAFRQLPEAPGKKRASAEFFPKGKPRWYLGYDVDIVRRNSDGSVEVLSSDPAYSEMNHHISLLYFRDGRLPQERGRWRKLLHRGWRFVQKIFGNDQARNHKSNYVRRVCGQYPLANPTDFPSVCYLIGIGSEQTGFRLPKGYGIKVSGGYLKVEDWHWENPAEVSTDEEIYIRLVMHWDDNPTGYRNTYVAWLTGDSPDFLLFLKPGSSNIDGPDYEVNQPIRIVAIYPHTHDHSRYIELRLNGKPLRRFTPRNAMIPVKHSFGEREASPLHASSGHLPVGGLTPWLPGENGLVLKAGDKLNVFGSFSNPHNRPIDNMIIFYVYWENLQDSPAP